MGNPSSAMGCLPELRCHDARMSGFQQPESGFGVGRLAVQHRANVISVAMPSQMETMAVKIISKLLEGLLISGFRPGGRYGTFAASVQSRPVKIRISRITTTTPSPPLGP